MMKQSTSFTQVANKLLTVLQRYTKGIRFVAVVTMLLIVGIGQAWGAEKTITLTYSSFSLTTSYAQKTATVDGIGFTVNQGYKGTNNVIQMNSSKGDGTLYNTTSITGLKSITINVSSGSKTYTITSGTSQNPTGNSQTGTSTKTFSIPSGDTYFQLKVSGASYFTSIVITYDETTSGGDDNTGGGSGDGEYTWELVTDASTLKAGDEIVIAASDHDYALSTTQNSNNRGQASVTKNGNNITFTEATQILTLETGTVDNTLAFNTGAGYLYAASSGSNHLKTQTTNDDNGSWTISIDGSTGVATIKAQGTNTRNWLRYNSSNNPPIFSCYGSGQGDVCIYKKAGGATTYTITSTLSHVTAAGGNPTTVTSEDTELELRYSADTDWNLPENITITMGGNELTDSEYVWDNANGDLLIQPTSGFTGNIVVTINGWQQLAAPTGLNVTNITSSGATLKWNAVTHATSYTVQVYGENDEIIAEYTDLTQTTKEVSGLESDTYYIWAVTAIGDGTTYTDSEESETAEFTTLNPCEQLGAATGLTVETNYVHTDGKTYVKFSWTPADNTKNYAASQKLCFGKVGEAGTCVDDLAKNLTWTGDLASKLSAGEYEWSIQALGDGTNYCDGDVVEGTNFYIYSITYNTNGGNTIAETSGTTLPDPLPIPTREHYNFEGWYTDQGLTQEATAGAQITQNTTLYAKWTAKTYTITLDANGGTFVDNRDSQTKGSATFDYIYGTYATYNDAPNLTDYYTDLKRDGYQFDGWVSAGAPWNKLFTNTGDRTIQAQWSKLYSITLSENGTTKELTPQTSTSYTLPTELSAGTCQDDTKELVGWSTVAIPNPGDKPISNFYELGATVTLTADQTTFYAVFATAEGALSNDYNKITDINNLTDGNYVIAYGYNTISPSIILKAETNNETTLVATSETPTNDKYTSPAATNVWEIKKNNSIYTLYNKSTSKYIQATNTPTLKLSDSDPTEFQISYSNDHWKIKLNTATTYQLVGYTNQSGNYFQTKESPSNSYKIQLYKSASTIVYSDYSTTCVKLPDPVWNGATIDKNSFTVNCGERSPMTGDNGAAKITFSAEKIYNFTKDITIEATTGFLVSTSQSVDANYQSSVSLSPLVGTTNANTFYNKFVYVRAEAPAQSDTDLEGTITIKNSKDETLQTFYVTADVTCNKCTVQFVDRGANYQEPILRYSGETIDEAPTDPEGVCTDPIHYVFDGWAEAEVSSDATSYSKVSFPYEVTGNTQFYAVYRYTGDGGEPSNDFVKVTSEKDDWTGDYVIVNEDAEKAIGNAYKENTSSNKTLAAVAVTITDNKVVSPSEDIIWQIRKNGENYTMYNAAAEQYAYVTDGEARKAGLSNSPQDMNISWGSDATKTRVYSPYYARCFSYYSTNSEWRTYATSTYSTGTLYCRSLETYLYTTSPVCGPHLAITEGKEIYVTGGNAGGTRDLVMASQKVSYQATRLKTQDGSPEGTAPDVKVATNGITKGGVVTTEVKVTFENTVKELQPDDTYTITGDIVVTYEADANNMQEDIQVQLAVDYPANADARDNFIVHARSLPEKFVIVAKQGDKWYALNADMSSSKAQPANGQVTLNDLNNPTEATYAPCNAIYTFEAMPQGAEDRISVRFIGQDNKYLWAASGTNTGIQNNSTNPAADALAYNWKLYTQDNITYQFGNANSNRQLTLSDEKFGMYASGVQDIRILPYDEKCLYNYAPSNLKVSVLKGTYVTLTWDAVIGATKYQYSTNGTTWTDCGTEPTATINGLTGDTEYTYYIRAYHEDAGVTNECIDYAEITFTTADCDDVPSDITCSADMTSITVTWTADAATSTVTLYSDAEGTAAVATQTNVANYSTIFTNLTKNTQYYVQVLADGTCASPIIPVKTEDVEVDIVEWMTDGIIVDINTDETVGVTLENEVSYGSGLGTEATELFFSKYYEASYNVKLVAIYNGTKNIIDLTDYTIQYGKTSWESNYITLKDFGATKGQIQPGEEIILYSYLENNADDKKILDCVHDAYPDGNWVRVTSTNNDGHGTLSFGGDKTIILCKTEYDDEADKYYDYIIDVIGALIEVDESILPTNTATEKPSWGDAKGWVCETGLSIADDSPIGISTNRCLLIRNNTVTSGDNAVTQNIDDFGTLCTEWKGAHVPDNDIDNGVQASCDNFAYVGTFDYSDYYTKYVPMDDEDITFDRNDDGTVTIKITDLYKHACSNIRVKLTNSNSEVLSDREYKVPIMITTTQGTDGQTFLDLQQNLATKEVDDGGNVIDTHPLSLEDVREICKTCDVVVRDNATLTKVTDGTENDHPQVHDVIVYEGASIVIPDGNNHNYTINSLSLRRKGDKVASAQVQGTGKFVLPADAPVTLSMRIDANNWHWFTLPYDCDIADVTWSDGTPAKYNTDWFLMYYDGESRAASTNPYDNHWKVYSGTTIEAGKGYIIGITGNLTHPDYTFELHFPMEQGVLTAEQADKTVALNAWGVKSDNTPNNKGWNLVGNPYLNYYKTADEDEYSPLAGLPLIHYIDTDPVTGEWNYEYSGSAPYLVIPQDGGMSEYQQELASEVNMMPFTAYFVQVGDPNTHENGQALNASFEASNRGKKSILRRAPSEVDELEEPAIVAVSLTNAKGESDKTTLLIANRFTNEYEMNADFFKWFGDYYTYYTKPVLYTLGADQGKRAFNALNEELAAQPVALGMYAAQAGEYTFSLYQRSELSRVEEVWLHDATSNTHTNLMLDNYTFSTSKTDGAGRFSLSVKMKPKIATDIDDIRPGQVWATSQDNEVIVNGLNSGLHLWLYDAVGKLLYAEPTTNYQHCYTVPQDGVYFITVKDVAQVRTIKVVVE